MRRALLVLVLVLGSPKSPVIAEEASALQSDLPFLMPNQDYVIRFSESVKIFENVTTEVLQSTSTDEDGNTRPGSPATVTIRLTIDVFTVVKLGKAGWVFLEHPENFDDIGKWSGRCRAKAILSEENIAKLEATPEGKETLNRLRTQAAFEIQTTRTWVNLNHAIAIADVPHDIPDCGKLKLQILPVP